MHAIRHLLPVALATALPLAAQCQFSTVVQSRAGDSCNFQPTGCCGIPSGPTQLVPRLDTTNGALEIAVPALAGCCGVAVPARALLLGDAPAVVPLPGLGLNCTLWVQPAASLALANGDTFVLPIPPTLLPLTILAQAAVLHTQVLGPTVVTLSGAFALALQ